MGEISSPRNRSGEAAGGGAWAEHYRPSHPIHPQIKKTFVLTHFKISACLHSVVLFSGLFFKIGISR